MTPRSSASCSTWISAPDRPLSERATNWDSRLREALTVVASVASLGVLAELALIGHWHGAAQVAPWVVAQTSLSASWAVSPGAGRLRLRAARVLCAGNLIACGWGMALHLEANWGFASELNRTSGLPEVALEALRGRIPLLAPLFGAMPSLLVLLATWGHPGFGRRGSAGGASLTGGASAGGDAAVGRVRYPAEPAGDELSTIPLPRRRP